MWLFFTRPSLKRLDSCCGGVHAISWKLCQHHNCVWFGLDYGRTHHRCCFYHQYSERNQHTPSHILRIYIRRPGNECKMQFVAFIHLLANSYRIYVTRLLLDDACAAVKPCQYSCVSIILKWTSCSVNSPKRVRAVCSRYAITGYM